MTIALESATGERFFRLDSASRMLFASYGSLCALALVRWLLMVPAPDEVLRQVNGFEPGYVALVFAATVAPLSIYMAMRQFDAWSIGVFSFPVLFAINFAFAFGSQFTLFYIGSSFPIIDAWLHYADTMMGFDWVSYYTFVCNNEYVFKVLAFAYHSALWQPLALTALLIALRNRLNYYTLYLAFALAFVLVCFVALFFPALNAHHFYAAGGTLEAAFAPEFSGQTAAPALWARDYLRAPGAAFGDLRVITFPSFHAAMAAIFISAAWAMPVIRWPFVVLNVLLLAATPPIGSHYLIDVIAGCLIGLLSWVAARTFLLSVSGVDSSRKPHGRYDAPLWAS
jgi:hypothetical protein